MVLGYQWALGKYVQLTSTYYGNNNTYFRPAFAEFDAQAGYAFTPRVSLLVTFQNITGIYGQGITNYTLGDTTGLPTVGEAWVPVNGQGYGPRVLIVTAQFHM
jgi:TonB dependent receptor